MRCDFSFDSILPASRKPNGIADLEQSGFALLLTPHFGRLNASPPKRKLRSCFKPGSFFILILLLTLKKKECSKIESIVIKKPLF
jgi:hypothetical protein